MDAFDKTERLLRAFIARAYPPGEEPAGFREWVLNLHDVYLNVEMAWLASVYVPPSEVEYQLENLGASRRQRLARFLARDMWVLWEAWDRRSQFHDAFEARAPAQVAALRRLESVGEAKGSFKRIRSIRDYMNHRDMRDYSDLGREELPDEVIVWMNDLRRSFSELLLTAMGIPIPKVDLPSEADLAPRNSTIPEIATSAVSDLLVGTVTAIHLGSEEKQDEMAMVAGHFGRAFTSAACGSTQLWSEAVTALIRRSVVAWSRLGEFPELQELLATVELDHDGQSFFTAITTSPAGEVGLPLAELSQLAVHRTTAWLNSRGDLTATLAAAVAVTGMLVSTARHLEDDDCDIERFVAELGQEADELLSE